MEQNLLAEHWGFMAECWLFCLEVPSSCSRVGADLPSCAEFLAGAVGGVGGGTALLCTERGSTEGKKILSLFKMQGHFLHGSLGSDDGHLRCLLRAVLLKLT